MSIQGLRSVILLAAAALGGGCAGVPPVPEYVKNNPEYAAAQDRRSGDPHEGWLFNSLTGQNKPAAAPAQPAVALASAPAAVTPVSATEPALSPPANLPPASVPSAEGPGDTASSTTEPKKSEEKKSFQLSDLAPENIGKTVKKAAGYGPDEKIARQNVQEGEALFRERKYKEAIPKFKTAASRWPDSTLEEDAQFLLAESYFFSDQYPSAHDTYGELLKKHDNSRYLDTIMSRQFAIGRYWEQVHTKNPHWPITPNVADRSRPWFDTFGNALKAYQTIRMQDPTGPLADSAVMATANAHFVAGHYEDAAYNYDLLRKEYPTSRFQPQAHVLGLQAKLRMYQGKDYEGSPLNDAEEIAKQSLTQFGDQLGPDKSRVARTAKEITEMKAEREWAMGQYYEKKRYYGAARSYYTNCVKDYPLTQRAQMAQARIEQIRDKPDVPVNHFKWLTRLFDGEQ